MGKVGEKLAEVGEEIVDFSKDFAKATAIDAVAVGVPLGGLVAAQLAQQKVYTKKVSKVQGQTDIVNQRMLEAAYLNDVEDFKQALKDGANFNTLNRDGQDVLMIAIRGKCGDVVDYLLDTPELSNQIDFKRRDFNGESAQDILNQRLIRTEKPERLAELNAKITKNIVKQTLEEAQGKVRSDTNYDLFEMMDHNLER